jgi:hypothetical protein
VLLQANASISESDLVPSGCLAAGYLDTSTLPLRVGGLFIILVASAVGVYLPLFSTNNRLPTVFTLGKAFAGACHICLN